MLHASDHTLMNLSSTLDDFLKLKKMKHNKLILKTSEDWDPTKEMQSKEIYDPKTKSPKLDIGILHSTPKIRRQNIRRNNVPEEPSLMEDSTLIFVRHPTQGMKHRLFLSKSKMEDVYNWVGSLSPEPELFHLLHGLNNELIVDTNEKVEKFDSRYLTMVEVEHSNFTMDLISGSKINTLPKTNHASTCGEKNHMGGFKTSEKKALSLSSGTSTQARQVHSRRREVRCPVCKKFFASSDVEEHAIQCADEKFANTVVCDDDESTSCSDGEDIGMEDTEVAITIKDVISSLAIDFKSETSIRIRRGNCFDDLSKK
eukprot:TCONS_00035701-protein